MNEAQLALRQQKALLRLHMMLTAETHRILSGLAGEIRDEMLKRSGRDGELTELAAAQTAQIIEDQWNSAFISWEGTFGRARAEAAAIPLGALTARHNYYREAAGDLVESVLEEQLALQPPLSPVFQPQLQAIIDAANQRIYSDGLQLSDRIWRLDQEARQGLRRTLYTSLAQGRSAWATAHDLEQFLGADQGCPRWTSTRLFRLSPRERLTSDTGLYSGSPCLSRGVAYKALRLARNEIQIVHHMATRALMVRQPWVEGKYIRLSAEHPEPDICDDYAAGGPYDAADEILPLHVQCLCYAEAALMAPDAFVSRLQSWMEGRTDWPEMDDYQTWVTEQVLGAGRALITGRTLPDMPVEASDAIDIWADSDDYGDLQGRLLPDEG